MGKLPAQSQACPSAVSAQRITLFWTLLRRDAEFREGQGAIWLHRGFSPRRYGGVARKKRQIVVREFQTPELPSPVQDLERRDPDPTRPRSDRLPAPLPSRERRPAPRRGAHKIDLLSEDEVLGLIALRSQRSPSGLRNRALLALLFGSGLRIAEALSLQAADLDLAAGVVRVAQWGKGCKPREVRLVSCAATELERWTKRRTKLGFGKRAALFCTITDGGAGPHATSRGARLSDAYVRGFLSRLAKKARATGFAKRLHAHGLRHSHTAYLRAEGWDVREIQLQLGHASLAVTGEYLERIGVAEMF